jgi:transposase
MAAVSLQRSKTALGAAFRRIARHKDAAVAVFATARKLAQLVYRMLRYGQDYVDIGEAAYELRFQTQRLAGIAEAAKSLGYTLVPVEQEPATV